MGRIKNRGQQALSTPCTVRRWRLGEYIRLSKEDLKKGRDDSNSVKNQRDLPGEFYQKHIDEFESMSEYVDDSHTGTDSDREDFQRLIADVMSGKIDCVIVKDLRCLRAGPRHGGIRRVENRRAQRRLLVCLCLSGQQG